MRRAVLVVAVSAVACHASDLPSGLPQPGSPVAVGRSAVEAGVCEKDLSVPVASVPYCLSPDLQQLRLDDVLTSWCSVPGTTVSRASCGELTMVSRQGDPSAPLHGSETLYFDRSGHVVARTTVSNEWGPRTQGQVPRCAAGAESPACPSAPRS